jgi:hypothetical protein
MAARKKSAGGGGSVTQLFSGHRAKKQPPPRQSGATGKQPSITNPPKVAVAKPPKTPKTSTKNNNTPTTPKTNVVRMPGKAPPAGKPGDTRVEIMVDPAELYANVSEAAKALRLLPEPLRLYSRGGELSTISRVVEGLPQITYVRGKNKNGKDAKSPKKTVDAPRDTITDDPDYAMYTDGAKTITPTGTPQIRRIEHPTLRERLTKCSVFMKMRAPVFKGGNKVKDGEPYAVLPPEPVVQALMKRAEWTHVNPLVSIAEAPVFRGDGTIWQTPGYDERTGVYYAPTCEFPRVPEKPTKGDIKAALALLREPFVDFPFAAPEHRAVPLCAMLTLLARNAVYGSVPAFLFDASTPGSGKTLLSDIIAMVSTGREAPRARYPSDDDELEKYLTGCVMSGQPLIVLDNIAGRAFGGASIDRMLTAKSTIQVRLLGKNETPILPWIQTVMGSGNNIHYARDTVRRVLVARLEPNETNPELRKNFKLKNVLGYVKKRRPELVVAGLTVLRGYLLAGAPKPRDWKLGSFEEWSALVPSALRWAGAEDALQARPARTGDVNEEDAALDMLLSDDALPKLQANKGGKGLRAHEIIAACWTHDDFGRVTPSGAYPRLKEAIDMLVPTKGNAAPTVRELGYKLRHLKGRVSESHRKIVPDGGDDSRGLRWSVVSVDQKKS